MKKTIVSTMVLVLSLTTFSQQITPAPALTKQDYLQKSKNKKTTAWILLGGGLALGITSAVIATPTEGGGLIELNPEKHIYSTAEIVLSSAGIAAMLTSIPFFNASKKNKTKAMNMSANLKMEKATMIQKQSFVQNSYPAIALKIKL